jgi:hypothetical protein
MRNIFLYTLILFFQVSVCFSQIPGLQLFDNTKVHEIKITSLFEALPDTLTHNYIFSFGFGQIQTRKVPYTFAKVTIDGTELDTIAIRQKGFNSWWSSQKKPMKIDINRYVDQKYDGLTKFNLHNGAGDPSFLRENISYNLLRSLDVKVPRTAFATVSIDNDNLGIYRIVEQIDNKFLDVNFGNHDGNLYVQSSGAFDLKWVSNNQEDYYDALELENHQKPNDWSSLVHFLDVLNNTPDANFKSEIEKVFDVDGYLVSLAFDVTINNLDWYGSAARNFYLAAVDGKFRWLPWDYNLTWRENAPDVNINPKESLLLINRILSVPAFYDQFLHKFCDVLPLLASDHFDAVVDHEVALIDSLMKIEKYLDFSYEAFQTNVTTSYTRYPGLKEFAAERKASIEGTMDALQINCEVLSNDNVGFKDLKIYPMPANDVIHLETASHDTMKISIINTQGQVLMNSNLNGKGDIDVSHLQPGCYILRADDGREVASRLIVVVR